MEEVNLHFDSCQEELDLSAILTMIAGAEARIRGDAELRAHQFKDPLAGRLYVLFTQTKTAWTIPFYEGGLLEAWKQFIHQANLSSADRDQTLSAIGGLKEILPIRHWVAHGRYWNLKRDIKSFPPVSVATRLGKLYDALRFTTTNTGIMAFE